jgi:transcriptional regulator with XRE-family HTH domain
MSTRSKILKEFTQKRVYEVAKEIQVGRSYLSEVLAGKKQPSLKLCLSLQEATGIHYLYFLLPPKESVFFLMKA